METKKYQIIHKKSGGNIILHPETVSDIVVHRESTVKAKLDEIDSTLSSGVVSGVKGNKESTYRKGNVNLTAANIGAEPEGAVSSHNSSGSAHMDIRSAVSTAQNTADDAKVIAEGRSRAAVFDDVTQMRNALKTAPSNAYKLGDNLFIKATDVPDYWISGVLANNNGEYGYYQVSELETQKVDLTPYQKKTDLSLPTESKTVVGAITELQTGMTDVGTAVALANISISSIIDGTTIVGKADRANSASNATKASQANKWTTARTISVLIGSGTQANGQAITGSGGEDIDGTANKIIPVELGDSGVGPGTYSAIQVNSKGIAVAGAQLIEIGESGQVNPSSSLAVGGLFFKEVG